jgi:hypothetical protein
MLLFSGLQLTLLVQWYVTKLEYHCSVTFFKSTKNGVMFLLAF